MTTYDIVIVLIGAVLFLGVLLLPPVSRRLSRIVFWKQIRAEERNQRVIHLIGVRADAVRRLYCFQDDELAKQNKERAEAELKKLGVL